VVDVKKPRGDVLRTVFVSHGSVINRYARGFWFDGEHLRIIAMKVHHGAQHAFRAVCELS
jgi:hypothetical protein